MIKYYRCKLYHSFDYIINERTNKIITSLIFDNYETGTKWKFHDNIQRTIVDAPDISNITPEEKFQLSLVWDYNFPFDEAVKIISLARVHNYNFDVFKNIYTISFSQY